MTDNQEQARAAVLTAVVCRIIGDRAKAGAGMARTALLDNIRTGETAAAFAPDGETLLGKGTIAKGSVRVSVTSPGALVAWVAENYPTEIVQAIAPAFEAKILAASKTAGEPCGPGGELDVPGIEVTTGPPSPRITPTADADEWVADMLTRAGIQLDQPLGITGDAA